LGTEKKTGKKGDKKGEKHRRRQNAHAERVTEKGEKIRRNA
jgi:hypothetical protein